MARQMGALPAKVNLFRKCERSFRLRAGQFRKHRWPGAPWGNYDEKRNPAPPGGSRADFHRRRDRHLAPRPVHPRGRDVRRRAAGRDRAVDTAQTCFEGAQEKVYFTDILLIVPFKIYLNII